jgi:misacylated tRNA(Ala) deacylase
MLVEGRIDWARRYGHMRAHTAQHLLSALVFREHGIPTERARLGGSVGSFDLSRPLPAAVAWEEVVEHANREFFTRSVPVSLAFVTPEEFARQPGRSSASRLPQGLSQLRLVVIDGIDRTPCGGTHVRDTWEVGRVVEGPPVALSSGGQRLPFTLGPAERDPSVPTRPG